MANKSMITASSFAGEAFESVHFDVSDSDSWEVIDPSDSDDGNFSYGDDSTTETDEVVPDVDDLLQHPYGSPLPDLSMQSLVDEITHHCEELIKDGCEIDHHRQVIEDDVIVKHDGLIVGDDFPEHQDAYKMDYHHYVTRADGVAKYDGVIYGPDDSYKEESEGYDDDEDDDSDLDDELVPKSVNNKFERQRLRKIGKRAYPKMKKSKRMAYQYNRPGCVHGKHGLGLKHNLIW